MPQYVMRCSNNDLDPQDKNVDTLSEAKSIQLNHPIDSGKSDCRVDWTEIRSSTIWERIINPIKKIFGFNNNR